MIDDVRLPIDVEQGAVGGPGFRTSIISLASGNEQRNQEWSIVRSSWNIGYGIQNRAAMEAVLSFFYARRGRARGFRFRDWLDFTVTAQLVGSTLVPERRQLVRVYNDTENPYVRAIVLPVPETLKVYIEDVITLDYTLLAGGIIEFPTDPGLDVKASFEFDVPARFDTDDLDVKLNTYREGMVPTIPVVELRS